MNNLTYQEKRKFRKRSLNEKLYTISEELSPPFAIQVVIEGEGRLEEERLRTSLLTLMDKIPALRLKLKGKSWYFDEITPNLIIHNEPFSRDLNSTIFKYKMSAKEGRTVEIHVFQGDSTTLVVRVLHSLMDGVGVLNMIDTWFDIMNSTSVSICSDHITEKEFKRSLSVKSTNNGRGHKFIWRGLDKSGSVEKSNQYQTVLLNFDHRIDGLISKLTEWHVQQTKSPARFLVPVNIRRHQPSILSYSNLSLPIYLEVYPGERAGDINAKLLHEIHQNNELAKDKLELFGRIAPAPLLKKIIKRKTKSAQRKNTFPLSGFLSDLGHVNLERLKTTEFSATNLFAIPVHVPLAPFCMLSCQHSGGTRVVLSIPQDYNSESIKGGLLQFLKQEVPAEVDKKESAESPLTLQLCKIWSEFLGVEAHEIELNVSYGSYGGSSLNLLFIMTRIEEQIIKGTDKTFVAQVIQRGGSLTISDLEQIINKIPSL